MGRKDISVHDKYLREENGNVNGKKVVAVNSRSSSSSWIREENKEFLLEEKQEVPVSSGRSSLITRKQQQQQQQATLPHSHLHGPVEKAQRPNIFSKIFGSLFALSANSPATTGASTGTSFWENFKTMFNQAQASIFPPNLDFRRSDEAVGHGGGTGTGEKMKEGAAKSVEQGKATVENSARTAARIVYDAVHMLDDEMKWKPLPPMPKPDSHIEFAWAITWSVIGKLPYRVKTTLVGFWNGWLYFTSGQRDRGPDDPAPKKVICRYLENQTEIELMTEISVSSLLG
ncbi:hypothetical protein NC651_025868 [Populus alba x Populus x berolinensis]|nr:hypothetical protein NC651_025868 [Populus alba x Populus x berolinensis]